MFYDNLKSICDAHNIKITPLVLECGGTKGVIGGWKKGAMPNSDIVMKLSVRLNVPTDTLLFGKEKSSPADQLTDDEQRLLTYFNKLSDIDKGIVIGRAEQLAETNKTAFEQPKKTIFIEYYFLPASAGTGVYLDGCDREMIEVEETPITLAANFALKVSGDSMEPEFHDGDIVLVKSQPTVDEGDIGIFIVNNEGFIKKFGGDRLISLNPIYENIKLNDYDDIYCRGKVIGVL